LVGPRRGGWREEDGGEAVRQWWPPKRVPRDLLVLGEALVGKGGTGGVALPLRLPPPCSRPVRPSVSVMPPKPPKREGPRCAGQPEKEGPHDASWGGSPQPGWECVAADRGRGRRPSEQIRVE
jgi:hypothetical protein